MDKKHIPNVVLIFISTFIFAWSVWQHDVLVAPRMTDFYTGQFEFFTGIRTSVGFAYNATLVTLFVGYVLGLAALWFWNDSKE